MAIMTSFTMGAATARLSVANNAVATIDGKAIPGVKRRVSGTRTPQNRPEDPPLCNSR